ncbi:MAG: di-heme-cytochrome C peroxidase [Sphingomonas sp.]|uniref:di-heme-cytochrome C peroxidase n=1 Tax=Sphingomonas sp. TaxID=28214 RepID=UPI0035624827
MTSAIGSRTGHFILAVSASILALTACAHVASEPAPAPEPEGQNWTDRDRFEWYRGSQGSRLIPEKWLMAIEAPTSTMLFMDRAYFDRFNYLPADVAPQVVGRAKRPCPTAAPGDQLPIGFARDCQSDEKLNVTKLRWYQGQSDKESWIGLNCAACHTTRITYNGEARVIDGAPALSDFQGFTDALRVAMQQTLAEPAKWDRFAARVVTPRRPKEKNDLRVAADRVLLKAAFARLLAHQNELEGFNRTASVYGYGRLDAVGHILNKVAFLNNSSAPLRGEPDAPVSYPFIWNANQHDFVQWNGLVPNQNIRIGRGDLDAGALVRNTSEVIGVFADVTTRREAGLNGYRSSVDVGNLVAMEDQLGRLMSPKWPAAFGMPDTGQVSYGKRLFNQSCAGCHAPLKRTDLKTPIVAQMTPIWDPAGLGTDPWMACNTFSYQARGGNLTGTKDAIAGGFPLPAIAPTQDYLKTQAIGVLLGKKSKIVWIAVGKAIGKKDRIEVFGLESGIERQPPADQPLSDDQRLENCKAAANALPPTDKAARTLAYKGRPLNGIWATAPYLHNGSVRSLYDLLLSPEKRPTSFWVGNREFDPRHVGFVSKEQGYGSWFRTKDANGRNIFGNSNLGHDYGNRGFGEDERMALVAYMKTL